MHYRSDPLVQALCTSGFVDDVVFSLVFQCDVMHVRRPNILDDDDGRQD